MFENGFFGFFKSGDKPATSQEQTWNPTTMTMEPPRNYSGSSTEQLESQQQEQLKLRGGGAGNVCCGICAGILCFECCC
ncbi:hypothetical protein VTN31DRAFT_3030 [Thermomyces dupontii]|uniref:uncharacterized protein n=1 Tax=Talaromyces thermophilus TaxID=28565 RepID=UPI003741ED32